MATVSQDGSEPGSRRGLVQDCAWSALAAGAALLIGYWRGLFVEATTSALTIGLLFGLPSATIVVVLFGYSERAREFWGNSFRARALPLAVFIFGTQYLFGRFPVTTVLTMLVFSAAIVPLRTYLYFRAR